MEAIVIVKALVERLKELDPKWSGKTGFVNANSLFRIAVAGYYPNFVDGVATITVPSIEAYHEIVYRVTEDEWIEFVAARREWEMATFGNHMETPLEAALINATIKRHLGVDPNAIRREGIKRLFGDAW